MLCFIYTCTDSNSTDTSSIGFNEIINLDKLEIITSDTIGFWGTESPLYNDILINLPFEVDSFNLVRRICGNEPKCYTYSYKPMNLEVDFCQDAQTIKDYYLPTETLAAMSTERNEELMNAIKENGKRHKNEYQLIEKDSIIDKTNSKWDIAGIKLHKEEVNSFLINCINTKTLNGQYFIYTTIRLQYSKSNQSPKQAISLAKFLCSEQAYL